VKIVKIAGGLGNQMFQYAFARSLAGACGDEVFIDSSALTDDRLHNGFELARAFEPRLREAQLEWVDRLSSRPDGPIGRLRRKYFTKSSHIIDRKFGYQPELFKLAGDIYFEGYWQSEKYFQGREGEVRGDYTFRSPLSDRNLALLGRLARPIVAVHVRRGDYLKHPNLDLCTPAYYRSAAQAMLRRTAVGSFLVLSDDSDYCRSSIRLDGAPVAFADWNNGDDSWQDMALMSRCDHNIIANSSFSWWGAWLNPAKDKRVIAPSVWNRREIRDTDTYYAFTFGDIVPESWERVAL
jgi:hypothetical protein